MFCRRARDGIVWRLDPCIDHGIDRVVQVQGYYLHRLQNSYNYNQDCAAQDHQGRPTVLSIRAVNSEQTVPIHREIILDLDRRRFFQRSSICRGVRTTRLQKSPPHSPRRNRRQAPAGRHLPGGVGRDHSSTPTGRLDRHPGQMAFRCRAIPAVINPRI